MYRASSDLDKQLDSRHEDSESALIFSPIFKIVLSIAWKVSLVIVAKSMVDKQTRYQGLINILFRGKSANEVLRKCPELCLGPTGHEGRVESYLGMATTLAAMGVTPQDADSSVRISFGWNTTEEEIDRATEILAYAVESTSDRS